MLYVGIRHVGEVALEQQAPWGRPPFGALMQLRFSMARVPSVAIIYLLSNRAEKTVCPPGPCGTLEFAVPDAGNQAGAVLAVVARLRRVLLRPLRL